MEQTLIPYLFRTEYRKITAVLCRHFGFEHMETAEDIASDTFLTAAQSWGVEGGPPNPVAWLYTVAKNKARNFIQRSAVFEQKISPELARSSPAFYEDEIDWSVQNINDSQLQMMFVICHPAISPEAQVGLSLRILCGFGIEEIADAFLTGKETINKRLFRARGKLREEKLHIELPGATQMEERLEAVLGTVYLLFNEGYYSVSQNKTLRRQLCLEAMRLCTMLAKHPCTNTPPVNALLSLMCFHASRFDARFDENGGPILYAEQDARLWNQDLISKGAYFLGCAATGNTLSRYHLEAAIASWHTQQEDTTEKWENILQLYDRLLQVAYSPVAALNRIYALSKVRGKTEAIKEAVQLNLSGSHFYFVLLGELYSGTDNKKAKTSFQKAIALAKTQTDKQSLQKKLAQL